MRTPAATRSATRAAAGCSPTLSRRCVCTTPPPPPPIPPAAAPAPHLRHTGRAAAATLTLACCHPTPRVRPRVAEPQPSLQTTPSPPRVRPAAWHACAAHAGALQGVRQGELRRRPLGELRRRGDGGKGERKEAPEQAPRGAARGRVGATLTRIDPCRTSNLRSSDRPMQTSLAASQCMLHRNAPSHALTRRVHPPFGRVCSTSRTQRRSRRRTSRCAMTTTATAARLPRARPTSRWWTRWIRSRPRSCPETSSATRRPRRRRTTSRRVAVGVVGAAAAVPSGRKARVPFLLRRRLGLPRLSAPRCCRPAREQRTREREREGS